MKNLAVALSAFILTACSSIAQDVAAGINNSQLKTTVGKSYSQVMYEHPDFGKLIGRERVGGGSEIMKHVGDFGTASNSYGGIHGKQEQQARVVYFLVDAKGNVKDWATEFYKAGTASCWVGVCSGAKQEQVPSEELDRIVKTSSGSTLAAWRGAK